MCAIKAEDSGMMEVMVGVKEKGPLTRTHDRRRQCGGTTAVVIA